jgi:hypothetical protein
MAPRFVFPNLWLTKGMVLASLRSSESMNDWQATVSCSRNHKRQHPGATGTHCGLCTGCLFRRVSILAAKLPAEASGTYFEDVLKSASMSKRQKKADREVGHCAVITMDELSSVDPDCKQADISELAGALERPASEVRENVRALIDHHRVEWRAFLDELPKKSWVRALAARSTP